MKQKITYFFLFFLLFNVVKAQDVFFLEGTQTSLDTISTDEYELFDMKVHVYHNQTTPQTISYTAIKGNNSNWTFFLCEPNGLCYNMNVQDLTDSTFILQPNDTVEFKAQFQPKFVADSGFIKMTAKIDGIPATEKSFNFKIKVSVDSSDYLGIKNIDNLDVSIYPNPVKDVLNIDLSGNNEIEFITIYNVLGKEIKRSQANNTGVNRFNISNLEKGVYILKLMAKDYTYYTKSFIKK